MATFDASAPGAAGKNPFLAAAEEMANQNKQEQDLTLYQASQVDPDAYARDRQIGSEIGVPADVVGRNRDEAEQQAKNLRVKRFTDTLSASPSLQEAMRSGDFSKVAWDDFKPLQEIEGTMRQARSRSYLNPLTATTLEEGMITGQKAADYGRSLAVGGLQFAASIPRGAAGVIDIVEPDASEDPFMPKLRVSDVLRSAATPIEKLAEWVDIPQERRQIDTMIANGLGQVAGQIASGQLAGRALQTGLLYLQGAAQQDKAAEEAGTTGLGNDYAVGLGAAITGLTERYQLDRLLDKVGPQFKENVRGWLWDVAKAGGSEAAQEFLEGFLQNVTTKALIDPNAPIFDGLTEQGIAAGGTGAIVRSIVNTVIPGRQRLEGEQRAIDGAADGQTVAELVAKTQESKLNQRSPQDFQNFMKSAAEAGGRENVYISAEAVQKLNQSGVPLDEFFQEVPEAREQFEEALATGGDLVLPTEKFVPFVAKSENLAGLAQEARFNADALPISEVQQINQRIDELRRESEAELENDESELTPGLALFEEVRKQIRDAGYTSEAAGYQAAVVRDFFEQRAAELKDRGQEVTPLELYRDYGVEIRGPQAEQPNLETLGFLFNDLQVEEIKARVSPEAQNSVGEAIAIKRALATRGRQYDRNNIRDLTDILGYRPKTVFDAIDKVGGLSTGLTEEERQSILQAPISKRKKGSIYNYYPEELRRAFGDNVSLLRRYTRTGGLGIDDFAVTLAEFGILPAGVDPKTVDLDTVYDIISRQSSGELVISERDSERVDAVIGSQEAFQRGADDAGITPNMTVDEIAERLAAYRASTDGETLYQSEKDRNLIVQHNLTLSNLKNADKVGGLAVPSLAISRAETPLENFGEISLIGTKQMVDPAASKANKVFNADVYSPRYPSFILEFTPAMKKKAEAELKQAMEATGIKDIDFTQVSQQGPIELERNAAFMWKFLNDRGITPDVKLSEPETISPLLMPFVDSGKDAFELRQDNDFVNAAWEAYLPVLVALKKGDTEAARAELKVYQDNAEAKGFSAVVNNAARAVEDFRSSQKSAGKVDEGETRRALLRQISDLNLSSELIQATSDFIDAIGPKERIFDGFTPTGNRRYLDHNLDNVVKIMKRSLRDGEDFNYGVGSIRSTVAKQFKSLKDIQASRNDIVDENTMTIAKNEAENKFTYLADLAAPFAKTGGDGWFLDDFSNHLKEIAETKNPETVFKKYYNDMPAYIQRQVAEYLVNLRNMPTEYFEAKIQRAVGIGEFSGAIVPEGEKYDAAVQILNKNGVSKIVRYNPNEAGARKKALENFNDVLFQTSNDGTIRGSITLGETRTLIELGQKSDLSSLLHEFGHLFVKVTRDIASGPNAPERTVEIYRAMEKFVGAEEGAVFTVAQEEKLARGFEAYLREGKAPSISLREAFRAFQSWMLRIYKSIRQLNVTLTPEITATFDRMLASDAAIEANAKRYEFEADPAIMALLGKAEREDYAKQAANAKARGRERLLSDMLKQLYRENKDWYKNQRAQVRAEQERIVNSDAAQRAFHLMATGEILGTDAADPGFAPDDMRMDKSMLIERFGPEVINKLPRGKRAVYKEGGVDPENVAMMFNITSADELVRRLINLTPREARIEELTDQVMKERYGDILTDGTINREAVAALENDERGKLIARELQIVSRRTGDLATPAEAAKQLADDLIDRKKVPLAIQYAKYVQAQVTAAKKSATALAQGKFEKGVSEKRKQLLNHYLYMAGRQASQELTSDLRFFRRLNSEAARKNIDPDYLEQIYDILGRYNFSTSVPIEFDYSSGLGAIGSKKRQTLEAFIKSRQDAGDAITIDEIPEKLRSDSARGSYKEMTMSEFRGLRDTIRHLAHLGRTKQQLVLGREKRNLEAVTTEVADTILANGKLTDGLSRRNKSALRKMGGKYLSSILHPTTILRQMDGFKDLGPAFTHIKGVIDQAVNEKLVPMQREMAERFEKIWEVYSIPERANMASNQIFIESLKRSFTKVELMTVAMNWGNLSNRKALKEGYQWTDTQVEEMLGKLDKRDWDTIQATWDMLESYWPQVAALEKKRKGVAPKKIAAEPVKTPFGTYKGGYFPLRYDEAQDIRVSEEAPEELMQNFRNGRFVKAQTRNGATIERVGSGGRPVSLDGMATIARGLKQTAYDLSLYEAVTYSGKVLTSDRVRKAFQDTDNIELWQALDLWLKDVATGEIRASDFLSTTMRHIRTGFTVSKLAWNLGTVMVQPLGYTQTIATLGGKYAYLGVRDIMSSPLNGENSAFAKVMAMSSFMRERQDTFNKDITESMQTFRELLIKDAGKLSSAEAILKQSVLRPLASSGFYILGKAQYIIDVATWSGAYRKGLDQFAGDVEKAVSYADDIVKRSQSSGLFSDRSGFERGTLSGTQARQVEFVKAFTTLGSYMITKANIAYEKTKNTSFRSPKQVMGWTMDMAMLFMLEGLALAALRAQWPDDDEESKALWLSKMFASQVISTMPVAREFVSELSGFRGGGPFGSFLKDVGGLAKQLEQGEWDAALVKKMNNVAGVMLHLPSSQTNVVIDAMFRASEGEDVAPIDFMIWREKD